MTKLRRNTPSEVVQLAFDDMIGALQRHGSHLQPVEILAVAAQITGRLIALQDRATMTPDRAMDIVMANLREGNRQTVTEMLTADCVGSA